MPIRFLKERSQFVLTTKRTAYAFEILENRYLVHNYYGKKKGEFEKFVPSATRAYSPNLPEHSMRISPDTFPAEMPFFGHGDFRATALRITGADGSGVTDFVYDSYKIFSGRKEIPGLPFARAAENTKTLAIKMTDALSGCRLTLLYTVFYDEDVITRSMVLDNYGKAPVRIEKCMSLCLDLPGCDYQMVSMHGGHMREVNLERSPLFHGNHSFGSRRGHSSHHHNPFLAICSPKATEEKGDVYGFNLVYSGSFLDEVEVDQTDTTRVMLGLGSECFSYTVEPKGSFSSPEAIMTYSGEGFGRMSRNLHDFTRERIMPPYSLQPHPVVLNTWEACYFNIDEEIVVQFGKKAAEYNFDMLVMDDGWFGERDHDRRSLGDWYPDPKKFKNGLAPFIKRVRENGIQFGIWVEPEMINPDSELYRAHPEWAIAVPGRAPMLSRTQQVLDMANPEVIAYLKEIYSKTFDGLEIDYIKWDFNRSICDFCVASLPADRQGEAGFRFMLGTYELLAWFRERFPNAIIETCSGGGGRYDLGMMQYGFQIWTSDNTDPYVRTRIQSAALLAYPAATMSCHVAHPYKWGGHSDHIQTHEDEMRSLDFRYKVAVGGMLGYEFNILNSDDEYNREVARQIKEYKTFEDVIRLGDYFSLASPLTAPYSAYYYASKERREILFSLLQTRACKAGETKLLKIKEAIADATYVDRLSGKSYSGKELKNGIRLPLSDQLDTALLFHFVVED